MWLAVSAPAFDLQSHSLHSDGALPAAQVVENAAHAGVQLLALSDHDTVDGVDEALAAGADIIMLDNMPPETMLQAVERTRGRALLEASGGITLENIRAVAESGVDIISLGALTHSAKALDISLELTPE